MVPKHFTLLGVCVGVGTAVVGVGKGVAVAGGTYPQVALWYCGLNQQPLVPQELVANQVP